MSWFQERQIPNLPYSSIFVIDNAAYPNMLSEKCRTSSSRTIWKTGCSRTKYLSVVTCWKLNLMLLEKL